MLIKEYFLQEGMQQLEQDLWNFIINDTNISPYTNQFNELTTLCPNFMNPEYKIVERCIWGSFNPFKGWSWLCDHRHTIAPKDWLTT